MAALYLPLPLSFPFQEGCFNWMCAAWLRRSPRAALSSLLPLRDPKSSGFKKTSIPIIPLLLRYGAGLLEAWRLDFRVCRPDKVVTLFSRCVSMLKTLSPSPPLWLERWCSLLRRKARLSEWIGLLERSMFYLCWVGLREWVTWNMKWYDKTATQEVGTCCWRGLLRNEGWTEASLQLFLISKINK